VPAVTRKREPRVIPFSVLDLAPINQGGDAADAFRNSLDLAPKNSPTMSWN
jgi:hypothetical protein